MYGILLQVGLMGELVLVDLPSWYLVGVLYRVLDSFHGCLNVIGVCGMSGAVHLALPIFCTASLLA
jgi:hypothetical protein